LRTDGFFIGAQSKIRSDSFSSAPSHTLAITAGAIQVAKYKVGTQSPAPSPSAIIGAGKSARLLRRQLTTVGGEKD
jgi:hypothetical protein